MPPFRERISGGVIALVLATALNKGSFPNVTNYGCRVWHIFVQVRRVNSRLREDDAPTFIVRTNQIGLAVSAAISANSRQFGSQGQRANTGQFLGVDATTPSQSKMTSS